MSRRDMALGPALVALVVACMGQRVAEGATSARSLAAAGVVATFGRTGALVEVGNRSATLAVVALGRRGEPVAIDPGAAPVRAGSEVRTERAPGVVEWWRAEPLGLEHGITIAERPTGEGPLALRVAIGGALSPRLVTGDVVELCDATGVPAVRYAGLVVLDAMGRRVPARMVARAGAIDVVVDDAEAAYPLVVDPFVTAIEATLVASDGLAGDNLGRAVALSGDGTIAILGAERDDVGALSDAGSVRVIVRTGTTWAPEATLVAPDGAATDSFGAAVSITADGTRALVGVPSDDTTAGSGSGSVRVFLRTGTAWAQEAVLLPLFDTSSDDRFGDAVAISADGTRAIVGFPGDYVFAAPGGDDTGSARVFVRSGTTWTPEAIFTAPGGRTTDAFGAAVALSSDGSRAIVGAPRGGVGGTAAVFSRSGTSWTPEATLAPPDVAAADAFGTSLALSGDGSLALVGAVGDVIPPATSSNGSARVFLRTGTAWAQEAMLAAGDRALGDQFFGQSVGLSADGSRALVGESSDRFIAGDTSNGSARVFLRVGGTWTEEATLRAAAPASNDYLGYAVGLAADGSRALVGAYGDDTAGGADAGSATVFTIVGPDGSPCRGDAACTSGFCTDGVCCTTRCGGGTSDCQACSAALSGGADGTCAPLSAAVAPTVTCRAPADLCDAPESCIGGDAACPADGVEPTTTVCRPAADVCDAVERCTGSAAACPADALSAAGTVCRAPAMNCEISGVCTGASRACPPNAAAPAGTVCRAAATPCDGVESCDGASHVCPVDVPSIGGTTCRPAVFGCDRREACDGISFTCPPDEVEAAGFSCRPIAGPCDVVETCSGTSTACPTDAIAPAGTVCGVPPTSICDAPDVCTGVSVACPILFAPATTVCNATVSDVCDAPDHCTGTSADCMPEFLSGVECRAAAGACDLAESCLGDSPACPAEGLIAAGIACRTATDPSCDPEESCDGFSTACPADVTSCVPMPDAGPGPTDGGGSDGGVADGGSRDTGLAGADTSPPAPDAGAPPVAVAGCACLAGARSTPSPVALAALALVLVAGGERRRLRVSL